MPVYVVTRKSDGVEVCRYPADAPTPWNHMGFDTHDHVEVPTVNADGSQDAVITSLRMTKLNFIGRLGADLTSILAAARQSVDVEQFVKMLDWATPDADGTSIDLMDPRVIGALQQLEQAGIIAPGRAAEILA